MTATRQRRRTRKPDAKPTRPVAEVLLEIAYLLHTTRVIGRRTTTRPSASTILQA
jgi:hypothetical protein